MLEIKGKMMKVRLSSLLRGYPEKLNHGYEMDSEKLNALTEAYLNQEVEVWPVSPPLPSPTKSRKRQISETSTPSPSKKKQRKQYTKKKKEKPAAVAKPVVEEESKQELEIPKEPDVWTWKVTSTGFQSCNNGFGFADFNKKMKERHKIIGNIKQEEEEEEEEEEQQQYKLLEFYNSSYSSAITDMNNLYDESDSILTSTSSSSNHDNMQCLEDLPEFIL